MSKISVIVPIYRAETYLSHCIKGLCSQTLDTFEVVLVDDGSPDRSGEICDDIARKDSRFKVIHQTNGGVSAARQRGLEAARGEYIIHVDPDDWIEPDMLKLLYKHAKETDADMVICDYYEEKTDTKLHVKQQPTSLEARNCIEEIFKGTLHGSLWNKLVRKSVISKYGIRFPNLALCEDTYFNVSLLMHPVKVAYMPQAFYHYNRTNVNSVTRGKNYKTGLYAYQACNAFRELIEKDNGYWNLFIQYEMPWMAYLSLYYGSVNKKQYIQAYRELLQIPANSANAKIVHIALKSYNKGRMLMKFRKLGGVIRGKLK